MNRFEFAAAGRVIVGAGTLSEVRTLAPELGRRAMVVTGRSPDRAGGLLGHLREAGVGTTTFQVTGEPDVPTIERGRSAARDAGCDLVVGFGGGSALDAAKAIAALAANSGDVLDYLEVIGRGQPLRQPSLPCIAIPTTAGTGSETTRNAVLGAPGHRVKVSLRHPYMLPRVAIVDPELTRDLPPHVTASTGLDALTQLIEAYLSIRANPMTDALCIEGIKRGAAALPTAVRDGTNRDARADMALAAMWSGMALANAGLGAVHGFAGPIGGCFPAPHGAICAALLPHVLAVNLSALRSRAPESDVLRRFEHLARLVTGRPAAAADDAVRWAKETTRALGIPPLSSYRIARGDFDPLVDQARRASSMKANPIVLTSDELREILERAL